MHDAFNEHLFRQAGFTVPGDGVAAYQHEPYVMRDQ
jgi:hypothetical protein